MSKTIAALSLNLLLAATAAYASPSDGTSFTTHSISAGETQTFRITLNGLETTKVSLRGNGTSDLDLYVYDVNGHLTLRITDSSDVCLAEIVPFWTQEMKIVVKNYGSRDNFYRMLIL